MTVHAFDTTLKVSVPDAEAAIRDALGRQGFGVVSEIDVPEKLGAALEEVARI
jgi:uncharacterized protein (DUF302 family)